VLATLDTTAIFVTHDQEEAFLVGDEVAVMLDGRVAQRGTPADLYATPASRDVATFIGDANFVEAVADGIRAHTPIGTVPLACALSGRCEVVIRPEAIRAIPGDAAVVEAVEFYGHDAVYVVRTCDGCPLRARCLGVPLFRPGDRVALDYVGAESVAFGLDDVAGPALAAV
jgi:iron(III) transport system ATP-binding protein